MKWLLYHRRGQLGDTFKFLVQALADSGEGDLQPGYLSSKSVSRATMGHVSSALLGLSSMEQYHKLLAVPWGFVRDVTHWLANLAFSLLMGRSRGSRNLLLVGTMAWGADSLLTMEHTTFI